MLTEFIDQVDRSTQIFVAPPTDVIFLCGGKIPKTRSPRPKSLRDAFLRIPDNPALLGRSVRLAEDVNTFHMTRMAYEDLLAFELDFAQICGLILLFSESEGSIAELGAFSVIDELASRLLVIVRDFHLDEDSFIKLGPVQQLKNKYGAHSVYTLIDDDISISSKSIADVNIGKLSDRISPAIDIRFQETKSKSIFDKKRVGDIIKLMTGLVQDFGGLTAKELKVILKSFGVRATEKRIYRLMLCAEAALWVYRETRGFDVFYFALPARRDALSYKFKRKSQFFNRSRRRQILREFWEVTDPLRSGGIKKHAGEAA